MLQQVAFILLIYQTVAGESSSIYILLEMGLEKDELSDWDVV